MKKTKASNFFALVSILGIMLVSFITISNRQYTKTAWAEEEEEEEDDEEEDDAPVKVIDTNPENNKTQKTEYMTVYRKLSDTVTTKTDTIIRHDSDGDGLYDDEDPHPTINEYFVVKDDNFNGIDDRYEV